MSVELVATTNQLDSGTVPALFTSPIPTTQMVWLNKAVWSGEPRRSMVGCYDPDIDILNNPVGVAYQFGINTSTDFALWGWGGTPIITTPNASLPTNQWIHFVYRWDGTNSHLFVNNSIVNTNTNSPQSGDVTHIWVNGYPNSAIVGDDPLAETSDDFLISDYRIYTRALSNDEISTIYNLRGKDHIVFGRVGHWVFNEGHPNSNVSSVRDISGNENHLAPVTTAPQYRDNVLQVKQDYITLL